MSLRWSEWASRYDTRKVLTAEITLARVSDGTELTLRLATEGGQWDGEHNWLGCLVGVPSLRQRAQQLTAGRSMISYGELIALVEQGVRVVDGADVTWDELVAEYAWAGREVVVRVGGPELAWDEWAVVVRGVVGHPAWDEQKLHIPIRSAAAKALENNIPPNTYDTGPDSTKGRAKPLCWGLCRSISPVLIQEGGPWVYQVHDPAYGPIKAVDAVYVDGAAASGYSVDLAKATISFSSQPSGQVTADVRGRVAGGVWLSTPGQILKDMLTTFGGVAETELEAAAWEAFETAVPYTVGLYLTYATPISRAADSLLAGLCSYWGPTREGLWGVWRFAPPSGEAALTLTDVELLDMKVRPEQRLWWKVSVKANRCWSPTSSPASGVSASRRQWLAEQYRERSASDEAIRNTWPAATEGGPHQTLLESLDDAATVAGWWLELFGRQRLRVEATTKLQPLKVRLGDVVRISRERWGMEVWDGRVVELVEDYTKNQLKLMLWG